MQTHTEKWRNLSGEVFSQPLVALIETAIQKERQNGHEITVCVGSDSKAYNAHEEYATAVMIVRKGKGAFAYLTTEKIGHTRSIKERMLYEVTRSIEVAYRICPILEKYDIELEVHADINSDPNCASNVAYKEAMGYILGMGFVFKAKPHAFASSSCADALL